MANPFGGEDAYAFFFTNGIPRVVQTLVQMQGLAIKLENPRLQDGIGRLLTNLLKVLNEMAVQFTGISIELIVGKIYESHTASRPLTNNMESHILSTPGPLGLVRVGILSELERITNPRGGWGTFWRAQEYGTGSDEVVSQRERVILGTFYDSRTPPDLQQAGPGVGHDIAFVSGGSNPGWGTIDVEDPGRHFLRDGASAAGEDYIAKMAEVQASCIVQLKALMEEAKSAERPRVFTGLISA